MLTYTIVTSGGKATEQYGTLREVIATQAKRRTGVGVYYKGLLICAIYGGEVMWAIG